MIRSAMLGEAAGSVRAMFNRVVGDGDGSSWLDQMESGKLPPDWTESHASEVVEMLGVLAERTRHTRAVAGAIAEEHAQPSGGSRFITASHARLPLNRKERYYTGTVLPMIIADNGFAHLHRFTDLCGVDVGDLQDPNSHPLEGTQDIQFFTEYGFGESVFTEEDRARLSDRPIERDTPDVVLMGPDWLVAVEAKMYHRPTRESLNSQLHKQRILVDYWARRFDLGPDRVAHVLLLPEELAHDRQDLDARVITWQDVAQRYSAVGPAYWLGVLNTALERYDDLASPEPTFRRNSDELLTGEEIVEAHAEGTLVHTWMGRSGGKNGKLLAGDISTGAWRDRFYEVRHETLPGNPNWFLISEFITKTSTS